MRLLIAIAWFTIGLLVYYSLAFASAPWYTYWYLWDKGNYVLLFYGMCFDYPVQYKYIFKWLTAFALIRFLWEIISIITGLNVNNTRIAALLFILLTGTICVILFKELQKWQRQKSRRSS